MFLSCLSRLSQLSLATFGTLLIIGAGMPSIRADPVALQRPTATFSQPGFEVSRTIDGDISSGQGWAIRDENRLPGDPTLSQAVVYETVSDINAPVGLLFLTFTIDVGDFTTIGSTLGHFVISVTSDDRSLFADGLSTGGDVGEDDVNWFGFSPVFLSATNGVVLESGPSPGFMPNVSNNPVAIFHCGAPFTNSIYTISGFSPLPTITGFRIDVIDDDGPDRPTGGPGLAPDGNFVIREFRVDATTPEPATMLLLGTGFAGVAIKTRKRLKSRKSKQGRQ